MESIFSDIDSNYSKTPVADSSLAKRLSPEFPGAARIVNIVADPESLYLGVLSVAVASGHQLRLNPATDKATLAL